MGFSLPSKQEDEETFKPIYDSLEKSTIIRGILTTEGRSKAFYGLVSAYDSKIKLSGKYIDVADFKQSSYYASANEKAKREKSYKKSLGMKYITSKPEKYNEVHHLRLDRSETDPTSLVYLSSETHKNLHIILDLENEIEILTYFMENPDKQYVMFPGIGSVFHKRVYAPHPLPNISGITREDFFKEVIEIKIERISELFDKVADEIKHSMSFNEFFNEADSLVSTSEERLEIVKKRRLSSGISSSSSNSYDSAYKESLEYDSDHEPEKPRRVATKHHDRVKKAKQKRKEKAKFERYFDMNDY